MNDKGVCRTTLATPGNNKKHDTLFLIFLNSVWCKILNLPAFVSGWLPYARVIADRRSADIGPDILQTINKCGECRKSW